MKMEKDKKGEEEIIMGIACMPLVSNVPVPKDKRWTKTKCPVCGCECWETDTYKWAKQAGIVKRSTCTECAIKIQIVNNQG